MLFLDGLNDLNRPVSRPAVIVSHFVYVRQCPENAGGYPFGFIENEGIRGYEVENKEGATKTVGRQYVLDAMKPSDELVRSRLAYLCETTAMKLRYKGLCARGIMVYVRYANGDYWHDRKMFKSTFFTNAEVLRRAMLLYNRRPQYDWPREIGISCYQLTPSNASQLSLLEEVNRETWLTEAVDRINEQFGEFTITYASSLEAKSIVKQKIPFGSTRYFELLLNRAD